MWQTDKHTVLNTNVPTKYKILQIADYSFSLTSRFWVCAAPHPYNFKGISCKISFSLYNLTATQHKTIKQKLKFSCIFLSSWYKCPNIQRLNGLKGRTLWNKSILSAAEHMHWDMWAGCGITVAVLCIHLTLSSMIHQSAFCWYIRNGVGTFEPPSLLLGKNAMTLNNTLKSSHTKVYCDPYM